jgi:hypothetical protein
VPIVGCIFSVSSAAPPGRRQHKPALRPALVPFSAACAFAFCIAGCGKSGPPLPPLVKVPAPPADLLAERRGADVDLRFILPSANTDGSRPANLDRVDVYAITAAVTMTDEAIVKHGTRVATIDVKAPRDPDRTVGPEESDADVDAPQGSGLDQGALARIIEPLNAGALAVVNPPREDDRKNRRAAQENGDAPLLGPSVTALSRTYIAVGISTRGRKGPASKRVAVPLVPAPPAPGRPAVSYTETAVTVTWMPVKARGMVQEPDAADVLPSTPVGAALPAVAYHVYDVAPPDTVRAATRLTTTPVSDTKFEDQRMTWGERRCYTVRAVEVLNALAIEGDAAPAECTTLADTFPPAAPSGLQAVAQEGSISLIWDPNGEKDLAGYLVFRGRAATGASEKITAGPIEQAMFTDAVRAGVPYVYVVRAVDTAGNVSPPSTPAEATAR